MKLSEAALTALISQCAPHVAPETMLAIIDTESARNPIALGVNKGGSSRKPKNYKDAVKLAKQLKAKGLNFDVGLAQINVINLSYVGATFDTIFDPCTNIAAGAKILTDNYRLAVKMGRKNALADALSMYNTGTFHRGHVNGYVRKVYAKAGHILPSNLAGTGERIVRTELSGAVSKPAPKSFLINVNSNQTLGGPLAGSLLSSDAGQPQPQIESVSNGDDLDGVTVKIQRNGNLSPQKGGSGSETPEPPAWDVFAHAKWSQDKEN